MAKKRAKARRLSWEDSLHEYDPLRLIVVKETDVRIERIRTHILSNTQEPLDASLTRFLYQLLFDVQIFALQMRQQHRRGRRSGSALETWRHALLVSKLMTEYKATKADAVRAAIGKRRHLYVAVHKAHQKLKPGHWIEKLGVDKDILASAARRLPHRLGK